jgi:hypothetical protein
VFNKSNKILIVLLSAAIIIAFGASACTASVSSETTDAMPTDSAALSSAGNGNATGSGVQANGGQNSQGGNSAQSPTGSGVPQANITDISTLHGVISSFDLTGISITTDEGQTLYIQLGNSSYAQSIGFAPQIGENVTVTGFSGNQGVYCAITITLDSTGQVYTFRDGSGRPLWAGGNGKGRN